MSTEMEPLSIDRAIGQKILLAFEGKDDLPGEIRDVIRKVRPGGFTLYRALNIENPAQVHQLTQALQQIALEEGLSPFLIAADQEGGQLMAIGEGTTQLPGNLALGAAGSTELAHQAGVVLGRELAAIGINIDYAPCCDVNVNPHNPVVGTRSFGQDPRKVAALSAAMVAGIQASGVAAAAKHFPGHGDTASDSHHGVPVVPHRLERLREVELPPFAAAIRAGAKLVMTAHLALPEVDGRDDLPATLSASILQGLLRRELGFSGLIVTDALDMRAILQGMSIEQVAVSAVSAGIDLLLLGPSQTSPASIYNRLLESTQQGELDTESFQASTRRIKALKDWLGKQALPPELDVVGCAAHQAVATEIAGRSITLVRDQGGLLPLRLQSGQRMAVILPRPLDLTPADTSSYVSPALAQELRRYFSTVDEYLLPHAPQDQDIAALLGQVQKYSLLVLCTLNAYSQPDQASLVKAIVQTGIPCVVAALRMPYDLAAFPDAPTFVCTYSILEPSMRALAQALTGIIPFKGRLPVTIPGLYTAGHGLVT